MGNLLNDCLVDKRHIFFVVDKNDIIETFIVRQIVL